MNDSDKCILLWKSQNYKETMVKADPVISINFNKSVSNSIKSEERLLINGYFFLFLAL